MAWFNHAKRMLFNPSLVANEAPLSLSSDNLHVSLHTSSYAMSTDSDDIFTDTSDEFTGATVTSYRTGGFPLASVAVTVDFANDRSELDAADTAFTIGNGNNATFADIIILRMTTSSTGSGSDWNVIAHDDTFSATTTNGGQITLVWNAQGILHIT